MASQVLVDGDGRAPLLVAAHAVHDDVDVGDGEDAPLTVDLALQPLVVHVPARDGHCEAKQLGKIETFSAEF